jgi:hypothetical protein
MKYPDTNPYHTASDAAATWRHFARHIDFSKSDVPSSMLERLDVCGVPSAIHKIINLKVRDPKPSVSGERGVIGVVFSVWQVSPSPVSTYNFSITERVGYKKAKANPKPMDMLHAPDDSEGDSGPQRIGGGSSWAAPVFYTALGERVVLCEF